MLRHESLRAAILLSWPGVTFEQAVFGYSSESLTIMDAYVKANMALFKVGIPYPWEPGFAQHLEQGNRGALLINDLAKRIEGEDNEPVKP
jgi:hypothetical protein